MLLRSRGRCWHRKMKKIVIISAIILVGLGVLLFVLAPTNNSQSQSNQKPQYSQINQEVAEGSAYLLDVRTPQEFNTGHSAKAVNFDSVRIDQGEMPNIPKDAKVYLYCRSGNRATQVKQALEANGYQSVVNLGGLSQMQILGLL